MHHYFHCVCCALIGLLFAFPASSQEFPDRGLRLVVPFAPGGIVDYVARLVQAPLVQLLGQTVVVDNRPGAGGMTANEQVSRANADGYTLLINANNFVIIPILQRQPPYKMDPVSILCISDLVLTVNPRVPVTGIRELVGLLESRSHKLNYSSAGVGTTPFMAAELFKLSVRQDIVHVAYKGAGPATTAVLRGEVEMAFTSISAVAGFLKDGKLRAMATTGDRRSRTLPDIPTFVESGFPDVVVHQWNGIFVPADVPKAVVGYLNAVLRRTLDDSGVKKGLDRISALPIGNSPAEAAAFIDREHAKWTRVVRDGGLKAQIVR